MMRVIAIALVVFGLMAARSKRAEACFVDSVTPVAFGAYDVLSTTAKDMDGAFVVKCVIGLLVSIDLDKGTTVGGTVAARKLARTGGGTTLNYNLYPLQNRQVVWGNGSNGTSRIGPVLLAVGVFNMPVYGRIPARQDVQTGTYSDSITITINY